MEPKMEQYNEKIIVINDVPRDSDSIARWLKRMGYRCAFVSNVDEANDLAKHEDFKAIMHSQEFYFCEKLH